MNLMMFVLNKFKFSTTVTPNALVGRWEMVGLVISPREGSGSVGFAQVFENHNWIVNIEQETSIIKY